MADLYEDVTRVCMCGDSLGDHLESVHDIETMAGRRVRTGCSHAACECRMFRPKGKRSEG